MKLKSVKRGGDLPRGKTVAIGHPALKTCS